MRHVLTRVEILEADHPGLLTDVRNCLEHGWSNARTSQFLRDKYHLAIPTRTLGTYRAKRWKVQRQEIEAKRQNIQHVAELITDRDLDNALLAKLWQAQDELSLDELLKVRNSITQRLRAQKEPATDTEPELTPEQEYEHAQAVVAQVKEIFGIGATPHRPQQAIYDANAATLARHEQEQTQAS